MKAVIAAAGLSTRMYNLNKARYIPKCLLEITPTKSILERTIDCLLSCNINDIYILVGYKHLMIKDRLWGKYNYISNPFYSFSNNMASLWLAKNYVLDSEFVYLHGDLVFDNNILRNIVKTEGNILAVDFKECDEEDMAVSQKEDRYLLESYKGMSSEKAVGEWIGMAKFNTNYVFNYIEDRLMNGNLEDYDTAAFTDMANHYNILLQSTEGNKWVEIDYPEEYEWAKNQNWKM